jgi:hypothetical protein
MQTFNALEMAKRRWNHCTVSGAGNIAVVLNCQYRVVLCSTPIEAQAIASTKCCPENCAHGVLEGRWHEIVELKPPVPRSRLRGNFAAFMEAD